MFIDGVSVILPFDTGTGGADTATQDFSLWKEGWQVLLLGSPIAEEDDEFTFPGDLYFFALYETALDATALLNHTNGGLPNNPPRLSDSDGTRGVRINTHHSNTKIDQRWSSSRGSLVYSGRGIRIRCQ